MRFIFIDEIAQNEKKLGFFAVASLVLDSCHYGKLKDGVENALTKAEWKTNEEFKGRYIFSKSGDANVAIEKRIELVRTIASTATANQNARQRFCFAYNGKGSTKQNYLHLMGKALAKCEKPKDKTQDKSLVALYVDFTTLVSAKEVEECAVPVLEERGVKLVETPMMLRSSNSTAGLIAADVLAFLKSWDVIFPNANAVAQASLFETETTKLNQKKLDEIKNILSLVKKVTVVGVE